MLLALKKILIFFFVSRHLYNNWNSASYLYILSIVHMSWKTS